MINFHPSSAGAAEPRPRITVIGVGGAGGNAVNNMIDAQLEGVEFMVANTDAQSLAQSRTDRRIQLGQGVTQGLGAGARPDIGRAAAEESLEEVMSQIIGSNMVFITAGMGGGTGTGAAPVIARAAREHGILTVGVITKPFHFEGQHRMKLADQGIEELSQYVDTLIIIPNQNLFRVANPKTTFAEAFQMADDVLYSGVRGVTDLMVMPGLINLDFADIRTVMSEMGKAMMGTGEAEGEDRAVRAAEAAISNPLLDDVTMKGAKGVLINITGGPDITLFEVDEAAQCVRKEVDPDANVIFGSTFDAAMEGRMRVSVVATGIDAIASSQPRPMLTLVEPSRRPTAMPSRAPTLADRVATAERIFSAPSIIAATAPMAVSMPAPVPAAVVESPAPAAFAPAPIVAEAETMPELVLADAAPAAPAPVLNLVLAEHGTSVTAEAAPAPAASGRVEPTLTVRPAPRPASGQPAQGMLGIEAPQTRREPRIEPKLEPKVEAKVEAKPVAPAAEPARRGFIGRLASHVRQSTQALSNATPVPAVAPAPVRAEAAQASMSAPVTHPARIAPAERMPVSRSSEDDLLEIPAFLRRQAN